MCILLILAHFEASARVLVNCFYRFACRSSRVFGHLGGGRSFSKVIVFQGIFDHPPCIGLTEKLGRFKIFDIKRYLFFRSIRFTIKITPKLILVSRPPIHFKMKQTMFDQFWKSCINSWWYTSAASSLQFLKIKCPLKRSRGIWNSNNHRKIHSKEINILYSYGRSYPGWSRLPRYTASKF